MRTFNAKLLTFAGLVANTCTLALAQTNENPVILGYYPSWKRSKMQDIDFAKYTHVNIAFAIPNENGSFKFEDEWALPQILNQVRGGKAKALVSVGGWTGSNYFSPILKNNDAREKLISSMTDFVKTHDLDGIDIDWEYPGRLGNTCNQYDAANDAPNFLSFLRDLRARFDSTFNSKKLITLAVRTQPFDASNGPMDNVSEFAKYVDYTNIMTYDINGPWNSETGPNAPFNHREGGSAPISFVSAIDAWVNAHWPANQLVAGLGFYGRSSIAKQDMTRDATNQYQPQEHDVPLGDSDDAPWYDACAQTTSASGTWQWRNLREQGVLSGPNQAAAPWVRQWDSVSQTPWLFNPKTNIFLSYDDPDSIKIKSDYAASRGLAGVMIWSANMDFKGELIDSARSFGKGSSSTNETTSASTSSFTSSLPSPTNNGSAASTMSSKTDDAQKLTTSSTSTSTSTSSLSSSASRQADSTQNPTTTTQQGASQQKPTGNVPTPGSSCSDNGKYKCVDPTGRNSAYLVCSGGKWVPRSCAAGTACFTLGDSIVCNWPKFRQMLQGLSNIIHHE